MIKKLTAILGLLAAAAGTAFASNVAVLDLNFILEKFNKTVAIKTEIESEAKYAEETNKIKVDEFTKKRDEFNKAAEALKATRTNPTLSAKAKADEEAKVQKLYEEVVKLEQSIRQTQQVTSQILQKRLVEKMNVVLKEDIQPRIEALAKERKIDIIVQRGSVLFTEKTADITNDLLALLEKDFPAQEEAKNDAKTDAAAK